MFDVISNKITDVFRRITGTGTITEKNIEDALKEIRMSLLEADVNYKVVKSFMDSVKQKAMGEAVLRSVSPDQQFIKIVHDELVAFLGDTASPINLGPRPLLIMLIGLQGSGKTTTAAKLAHYLKTEKDYGSVLLVAADTYRPAAREQLETLSKQVNAAYYTEPHNDAVKIAQNGYNERGNHHYDAIIFDTAGRLHIDEDMIAELKRMKEAIPFHEIILVADSMLGQESVNVAKNFNDALGITGLILTKIDGDARGGAALSMKHTANVPIKFMGTGEKIDRFEVFHPERIAGRILGMGDVVTLVEKAARGVTEEQAKKTAANFRKGNFTLNDFLEQMQALKNMGPLDEMLKMIPGADKMGLSNVNIDDKQMKRTEAIILSMTPRERRNPDLIDPSRKARIAKGSGTKTEEISRLLKQFNAAKKMMKSMSKRRHGGGGLPGGMPGIGGFGGRPGF
ncbi:MAG: signal recognition particle protein [Spirochaetia bacterium]|nr:signal recognition particle protein [Spirochaetia bacterium]